MVSTLCRMTLKRGSDGVHEIVNEIEMKMKAYKLIKRTDKENMNVPMDEICI